MKKWGIFILFVLVHQNFAWAQAELSQRLIQAINQAGVNEEIYVSAMLRDRVDIETLDQELYAQKASPEFRAKTVIDALQQKAKLTQEPILQALRISSKVDQSSIKPLWVCNTIFFKANKSFIQEFAQRTAIEYMDINAKVALEAYVKEPNPKTNTTEKTSVVGGHEVGHDAIKAPWMWKQGYSGYGRLVMTIDTGTEYAHPALQYKFRGNRFGVNSTWFVYGSASTLPSDCDGHGTHTAGIMCGLTKATNDTVGVAHGAEWMGANDLCQSSTTLAHLASFQWAMDPDNNSSTIYDMPDAINNSWYDPSTVNECAGSYKTTFDAVEAVGIAIVFSAGNNGSAASTITMPKNINTSLVNVFCVANLDANSATLPIAASSSRGPSACGGAGSLLIKPEVAAPGTNVRSSYIGGGYSNLTGTSMASPHVVGAIALLKEAFPNLTGTQIKLALYNTCTDLGTVGEDNDYGMGIINLQAAYNLLLGQGNTPATYAFDAAVESIGGISTKNCNTINPNFVLMNRGDSVLTSVTVTYTYTPGTPTTFTWTGSLAKNASTVVNLPANTLMAGSYNLKVELSNPNITKTDARVFNNVYQKDFVIINNTRPVVNNTLICQPSATTLSATIAGSPADSTEVFWYASSTGNPIDSGNTYLTPVLSSTTTYYADVRCKDDVLPVDNTFGGGGNHTSFAYLIFDAYYPFKLKTVKVYATNAGNRTIQFRNSAGTTLLSKTVNLTATGTYTIDLDFAIPAGTDYQLGISGTSSLYRNNAGVSFPYTVKDIMAIKNSSAGTGFYYYYYDWEIEYFNPCGKTPVTVTLNNLNGNFSSTPQVNPLQYQFNDLTTGATSWQWNFGDMNTSTLQNPLHTYSTTGNYAVKLIVTDAQSCVDTVTQNVTVNTTNISENLYHWQDVSVYPNPVSDKITIQASAYSGVPIKIVLLNALGQEMREVYQGKFTQNISFSTIDLPQGTYWLKLTNKEEQKTLPFLKQ